MPKTEKIEIRCTPELKDELRQVAEADPDTAGLSDWIRRELRAGVRISKRKNEEQ